MFWRRKKYPEPPLVSHRGDLNAAAATLLDVSEVDFDSGTALQQALIGTFVFGMIYAHGRVAGLDAPEIHALSIAVYQDTFHYTPEAAVDGVENCIDAAVGGHDRMQAIIHRGIDGHRQYLEGDTESLRENIQSVLKQFDAL